jgi:putative hemolysin
MPEIPMFVNTLILLVILLGCSAFFSGSETALFSLNPIRIQHLKREGSGSAAIIAHLLDHPSDVLVTILLGNSIVNTLASSTMAALCVQTFGDQIGPPLATISMLFLLLIFGEVTPKTFAVQAPQRVAFFVCWPLFWFAKVIFPVRVVLSGLADAILWSVGGIRKNPERLLTGQEFRTLLDVSQREGVVEATERQIINNLMDFSEITVKEIMIPRTDMFCFSIQDTVESILSKCRVELYARVPVYDGTLDSICGIVYVKDLLPFIQHQPENFHLRQVLRDAYFVPESKKLPDLLRDFQEKKLHIAIAVDEYGGTAGLVCLEDVLEEIVGEIRDEFDTDEVALCQPLDEPGQYRINAMLPVHEFNQIFGTDFSADSYSTVGGLVLDLLGKVPQKGDTVTEGKVTLSVNKLRNIRIVDVIVKKENT